MAPEGRTPDPGQPHERRLTAEYVAARALLDATTIDDAAPKILEAICETLGWEHGALWTIDREADALRCARIWTAPAVQFPEFDAVSRSLTFARGTGLPGRVWASAEPVWIPDVVHDANFPRAAVAAREGLHAAFGFPVLLRGEVLSVMEFFSRDIRAPDADLLSMLTTVGNQIGMFIDRGRAQEERDRFFTLSLDMFLHRRVRRLLQTRESGVASRPRLHRGRAAVAAVPGSRPPRRSRRDPGGSGQGLGREGTHLLRESLPAQGRDAALADVDRRPGPRTAGHLLRRPRHHRAEGRRRDHGRCSSRSWRSRNGARRMRRKPRARFWPT